MALHKVHWVNPGDDWKVTRFHRQQGFPLPRTRSQPAWAAKLQWMPEHGEAPAAGQITDLSSVPIDKAQHHRPPEISQQRDQKQKTHTVRWCFNCLRLLTSLTPVRGISVERSSPPASRPFFTLWTHKSVGLGHIMWHLYTVHKKLQYTYMSIMQRNCNVHI